MFTDKTVEQALSNWLELNTKLMKYRGAEGYRFAQALLEAEWGGQRRPAFLNRIQGRLTRLQAELDRAALLHRIKRGRSRKQ